MSHLLIVEDEAAMRAALQASFRARGWAVETAEGVAAAVERFRKAPAKLVVTDMCLPDGDGLQVMQAVRELLPGTPVIFLTAYGDVAGAVRTMREGACDYLQKPVAFEELEAAVRRFLLDTSECDAEKDFPGVAESQSMRAVLARARQAAATGADVLIEAESGTGKELLARFIHRNSRRSGGAFVAVNCAAFPETLLESELFGHVKGAFTGALWSKPGKFALANSGTILLDEIAEMPMCVQPKLLRVLQEREIDRLGDVRPQPVDVRVIATTNRNLREQIARGSFREDLFYRLNVVPLQLPALRERREDILPLAERFVKKYAEMAAGEVCTISPELAEELQGHHWPGNVRELENFVRRALALRSGNVLRGPRMERNAQGAAEAAKSLHAGLTLDDAERHLLERTLSATGGNRTQAAKMMGVSLRTVRNKIRQYGLAARGAA